MRGFVGSFDELAVDEGGAGADEGDEVGSIPLSEPVKLAIAAHLIVTSVRGLVVAANDLNRNCWKEGEPSGTGRLVEFAEHSSAAGCRRRRRCAGSHTPCWSTRTGGVRDDSTLLMIDWRPPRSTVPLATEGFTGEPPSF
ncbi:MAG: hypothetical protein ACRDRK_21910 [Pseudonocardia sp.]